MGAPVIVIHAPWSFDNRCGQFSLLLGGRCRLLGAGRRLPLVVILLFEVVGIV